MFNHSVVDPLSTVFRTSKACDEFVSFSSAQRKVLEHPDAPWRKLLPGSFKINCDVAIWKVGSKAVAAVVARNDSGELIDGSLVFYSSTITWRVGSN